MTEKDYSHLENIINTMISTPEINYSAEDFYNLKLVDSHSQGRLYFGIISEHKYNTQPIVDVEHGAAMRGRPSTSKYIQYNYNLREFKKYGGFRQYHKDLAPKISAWTKASGIIAACGVVAAIIFGILNYLKIVKVERLEIENLELELTVDKLEFSVDSLEKTILELSSKPVSDTTNKQDP